MHEAARSAVEGSRTGNMQHDARKQLFLDELGSDPRARIAPAARRARVHRSTIYRWAAVDSAFGASLRAHQRAALDRQIASNVASLEQRKQARARRWKELRPQFQALAAYARSCKRR